MGGGAIYTLGPQPGSTVHRNYIRQPGSPVASGGIGIYHDNGSGGFCDKENVIEGAVTASLQLNRPMGPYGRGRLCPGVHNVAEDCGIVFSDNWLHTSSRHPLTPWPGAHYDNTTLENNTVIRLSDPLPLAAHAVASEAGPRHPA